MKHHLRKFLVILFWAFVFTSCSNFLEGGEFKKEIDNLIEISKAKEINVEINLKSSKSGTISPIGISKRKKGLPFEIELSVKNNYDFNGIFDLYEKSGGRTIPLKNPESIIKFVEKSKYHAGVGNWNYIYEVVILTDRYDSILINPHIINTNSTEPPVILDVNIDYRYGNDRKVRDYFDVQLFVECDAEPNKLVYASFFDIEHNDYIDGEFIGCIYDATIEDIGNGKYLMSATVDLREYKYDIWDREYKLILSVENDGDVKGSFEFAESFIKQSYSGTRIQIYNSEDTVYDIDGNGKYSSFIDDECTQKEESLTTFANNLKLIILDIDEEGLGFNEEGKPVELKYGFCQDKDEIESLELNNTISEYSAYNFESEFEELLKVKTECGESQKFYEVLEKYQNNAIKNKSIVRLSLPKNLDKKKDIYIKVSSETGIAYEKYEIFTIPAPTMVFGNKKDEEKVNVELYKINDYIYNYIYYYNPDLKKWFCDKGSHSFNSKYANYGFYASSLIQYEHRLEDFSIGRNFNLHTMDIRKYEIEVTDDSLTKFPSEIPIEIQSQGFERAKHEISITLDYEIYNQFDAVFIKYGLKDIEPINLQEDNVFSFEVATKNFYTLDGNARTDYNFSVLGVKNGISYETVYTIEASDDRVEDNVSPIIFLEETDDYILTNVAVDSTGNFLTIMGTPTDVGGNLPSMVPVDITIINEDASYWERISIEGDVTKYLNIPISHLENGTYILELEFQDEIGNQGSASNITFEIDRESVSDRVRIENTDENKFIINAEEANAQKYSLSYFDETENLWKPLETAGDVNTVKEYEKTGFFQFHLYNQNEDCKYNNHFKYPYLFYFPEEDDVKRDYQLWRNSIRIITDKPFFIHFLKSDTDWGKDIEAWENHQSYSYSIDNDDIYEPYYSDLYGDYFIRTYEEIKEHSSQFTGTEINPCAVKGIYTDTPYVCQIPWKELDKEYAAAVIVWADNKKDLILLDTNLR